MSAPPLRQRASTAANAACAVVESDATHSVDVMSATNGSNGSLPSQPLLRAPPSETMNTTWWARARARAHDLVEGSIDTWFEYSLLGVIFVNVLALLIASLPVVDPDSPWCDCSNSRSTRTVSTAQFNRKWFMPVSAECHGGAL